MIEAVDMEGNLFWQMQIIHVKVWSSSFKILDFVPFSVAPDMFCEKYCPYFHEVTIFT